jgi:hypothetical protein
MVELGLLIRYIFAQKWFYNDAEKMDIDFIGDIA